MPNRFKFSGRMAGLMLLATVGLARGDDWPWRRKASPDLPNSPEQIARSIDAIQEKILDDGVIVVKRPDVWGQNRMSTYRNDFEANMKKSLKDEFKFNVAGRVFRSEQAALSSQAALGASLTALKTGNATNNAISLDNDGVIGERNTQFDVARGLLPKQGPLNATAPGAMFLEGKPFQNIGMNENQLGIEPTVYLDEKKRFLDHLNEIRRVNLGDDVSDSAGYGLYLFRVPVSIQPGECTLKGHGGVVTATVRPEFGPSFLRDTYRTLVIADVVDQLSPVVYEMIRSNVIQARRLLVTRQTDAQQQHSMAIEKKTKAVSRVKTVVTNLVHEACKVYAWVLDKNYDAITNWLQDVKVGEEEEEEKALRLAIFFAATNALDAGNVLTLADVGRSMVTIQTTRSSINKSAMVGVRESLNMSARAGGMAPSVGGLEVLKNFVDAADKAGKVGGSEGHQYDSSMESKLTTAVFGQKIEGNDVKDSIETYIKGIEESRSRRSPSDSGRGASRNSPRRAATVVVGAFRPPGPPHRDEVRRVALDEPAPGTGLATRFRLTDCPHLEDQVDAMLDDGEMYKNPDEFIAVLESLIPSATALPTVAGELKVLRKAEEELSEAIRNLDQLTSSLNSLGATSLPSTRDNTRTYPIAPSDIDDVFLIDQLFAIAEEVSKALPTERKKAGDVRTYLQHQLEAAYEMLPYFESHIAQITYDVDGREFVSGKGFSKLRDEDYPLLAGSLPGDLRGNIDNPLVALCWAIAVDAGQLDKRLRQDMKTTFERTRAAAPDVDGMVFYTSLPLPDAHEAFCRYVNARWPMASFALDPVVDQQNIDDAASQRRDLQLALAFSFAAGRTSFENLNRYSKRLEQDAETIALNKTVSSFAHGADSFGWRFYPRYQNPPIEKSNLQTITNLVWRGGPGRDYGINNSKLEPGQRELTAVVVMPSFLERVKFEVVGNFFPLRDPDHMKTHSARMISQGRQIEEVREALASAHACGRYRAGDLERLASRLDQVEAMLPLQTQTVSVPYESTAAGFQLFTPGSQSLVPELIGFEGCDVITAGENTSTSLLIHTKRVSLHESHLVAGGVALVAADTAQPNAPATVEVVSRDVLRVKIPGTVTPTPLKRWKADGAEEFKPYVELYLSTPNGISNRLLIPYVDPDEEKKKVAEKKAAEAEEKEKAAAYRLVDETLNVGFKTVGEEPSTRYVVPDGLKNDTPRLRLRLGEPAGVMPVRLRVTFKFAAVKEEPDRGPITVQAEALPDEGGASGYYAIPKEDLEQMASQLVRLRQSDPDFFEKVDGRTKADAESQAILVTPVFGPDKGLAGVTKAAANKLKVVYFKSN